MVASRTSPSKPSHEQRRRERYKKASIAIAAISAAASVAAYASRHLDKQPMHTSRLTGQQWIEELLEGHAQRFRKQMGMEKFVFRRLLFELRRRCGLQATRHVSAEEQLAIFIRIARTGLGHSEQQERFQRSSDTISKAFHRILNMLTSSEFYSFYVRLPSPDHVPPEIKNNPRFFPYFAHCLGALDGSLLDAFVSEADMARYRSRKGRLSTNLLAACKFDLIFCYLLSGWEGSAADSRVFDNARRTDFPIPPGSYYLADAGFPLCDALLVPYRGVRYHLKEWQQANLRPTNYQELFNLRHSSLRNAIERIFGVCKRRFKLMAAGPEYNLLTQAKIPLALGVLHNFIRIHDPTDDAETSHDYLMGSTETRLQAEINPDHLGAHISQAEKDRAGVMRDNIAEAMWEDYQRHLSEQGDGL